MKKLCPLLLLLLAGTAIARLPVDEKVPNVTAYDSEGTAFPLQEKMKDHYSVIVFGCLT